MKNTQLNNQIWRREEKRIQYINKAYLVYLIKNTKGKIFFAVYRKNDGTIRKMLARTGVRYDKKTNKVINNSWKLEKGYISAYDMIKKGYRTINLDTLFGLNFKGIHYIVN